MKHTVVLESNKINNINIEDITMRTSNNFQTSNIFGSDSNQSVPTAKQLNRIQSNKTF